MTCPPAPERDRPLPCKGDILVVDDRPDNLHLLATLLTEPSPTNIASP
ncbi:MAG: hypothetical protein WBA99_07485 [Nodosilinea sp.]